jgi:hypothetical protein
MWMVCVPKFEESVMVAKIVSAFALLGLIVYLIYVASHPHLVHAWGNFFTAITNLIAANFSPGAKS